MKRLFILIAAFTFVATAHAQPDSLWSRTFGGRNYDGCVSIIQTADGGYTLAGYTRSFGGGDYDMWLVKTDADGDSLWSRTFGERSSDGCCTIIQTADGGYALAGYTESFGAGESDMWLVRTNADGDSLWSRTFGGESIDWCSSMIQTADGGYALAGVTESFDVGYGDMWLVRTDADGDSLWSRTFGGDTTDYCHSAIQTTDGGYALVGWTLSFGAGDYDMWLVKTDAEGDSLWSRTFGGRNHEKCFSIIQTVDGGYALAGWTSSFGAGIVDMWLVKTNADGDSIWSRTFGGEDFEMCNSIIQTEDGGYALAGYTRSFGAGDHDMWLVRTDEDGDSLWSRTFGGEEWDVCNSIIQTEDGGYAIAGYTPSFGAGRWDMWLVKTGPDPVSVPNVEKPAFVEEFVLLPSYPNPFNSTTSISYQIPDASHVTLRIFDISGREVTTLINGTVKAGYHQTVWNANAPSGIYICRMEAGGLTRSVKLVLCR